jgi:hypothetical protein
MRTEQELRTERLGTDGSLVLKKTPDAMRNEAQSITKGRYGAASGSFSRCCAAQCREREEPVENSCSGLSIAVGHADGYGDR